jgi:hypothetical protein
MKMILYLPQITEASHYLFSADRFDVGEKVNQNDAVSCGRSVGKNERAERARSEIFVTRSLTSEKRMYRILKNG